MVLNTGVATVTLNPAIDQTLSIPGFRAGEVNRVEWERSDPGGKGVNVAAFLRDVGARVTVTGLLGSDNAGIFQAFFADKGIADRFVMVPGRTRVNVKIIDQPGRRITDINLPGLSFTADKGAALAGITEQVADDHDWFVLSGSVPPGTPDTVYADLIETLRARNKRVVLDASGPAFARGVAALPYAVKPNLEELSELVGRPLSDEAEAVPAVRELIAGGIGCVIVSMGADGAIFAEGSQCLHVRSPAVVVRSTVGAGDAMVAGFIIGKLRRLPLAQCGKLATAFALGKLTTVGPHLPAPEQVEAALGEIEVRELGC
jgi:1-phosphofructokinase family hexose kinase